jgi:hypothetical protein
MQQPPVWKQAFYSLELVVEVPIQKLAIERKRPAEGDCEIIAAPIKKSRRKKQPKFKKVKGSCEIGSMKNVLPLSTCVEKWSTNSTRIQSKVISSLF